MNMETIAKKEEAVQGTRPWICRPGSIPQDMLTVIVSYGCADLYVWQNIKLLVSRSHFSWL